MLRCSMLNYLTFWQTNVEHLTEKMKKDIQRGLVLRYSFSHTDYDLIMAADDDTDKGSVHVSVLGILSDVTDCTIC